MLAGAAGMDCCCSSSTLAKASPADGEHLAILDFLDVQRAIVVLTKRDLVDDGGWRRPATRYGARRADGRAGRAGGPVSTVTGRVWLRCATRSIRR